MRFLYGDLSEFPQQENTLDLLKRFVDMAVEVLKLDLKINSAREAIEEDKQFLGESIQDIDRFHRALQEAIHQVTDNRAEDDVVAILAQGASDNFSKYISDGKGRVVTRVEQRIASTQNMIEQISVQILGYLRHFFLQSGIPLSGNALHCALDGERYTAHCEILDVTGIRCSYLLNPQSSEFFAAPKRPGDLLPGKQEFPIGTKQSRFKKAPVTDYIRIDESILYQVTENDELGEYRLAKRGGNGVEGLCVRIGKSKDAGVSVLRIDPEFQASLPQGEPPPGAGRGSLGRRHRGSAGVLEAAPAPGRGALPHPRRYLRHQHRRQGHHPEPPYQGDDHPPGSFPGPDHP